MIRTSAINVEYFGDRNYGKAFALTSNELVTETDYNILIRIKLRECELGEIFEQKTSRLIFSNEFLNLSVIILVIAAENVRKENMLYKSIQRLVCHVRQMKLFARREKLK